jgi:hypothetical protein
MGELVTIDRSQYAEIIESDIYMTSLKNVLGVTTAKGVLDAVENMTKARRHGWLSEFALWCKCVPFRLSVWWKCWYCGRHWGRHNAAVDHLPF